MANTIPVATEDDFVSSIVSQEDLDLTDDGASELWSLWTERYENGAEDDVLVAVPSWFAQKEFDRNRPYFFAQIEHDDPDKGAILFTGARQIDINVIENEIWDQVTMTEALDVLDISDEDDYIDERGKLWSPRSLMHVYERSDQRSVDDFEAGGLADTAAQGYDRS